MVGVNFHKPYTAHRFIPLRHSYWRNKMAKRTGRRAYVQSVAPRLILTVNVFNDARVDFGFYFVHFYIIGEGYEDNIGYRIVRQTITNKWQTITQVKTFDNPSYKFCVEFDYCGHHALV